MLDIVIPRSMVGSRWTLLTVRMHNIMGGWPQNIFCARDLLYCTMVRTYLE